MKKVIPLIDVSALQKRPAQPITVQSVDPDHMHRFLSHGMRFDKNIGLAGLYCNHPFNTVTIDNLGRCFVCICQAWLPVSVGNILDFDSLDDIVHSPFAREIQRSIVDGSYQYCDHNTCSLILGQQLQTRIDYKPDTVNWINFAIDDSCNLQCPSCRTGLRFVKEGADFDLRTRISDHVAGLISRHEHFLRFTLSGDGDPFASHVYRNLMRKIHGQPAEQLEIEIVTNGQLMKTHWDDLVNIYHNIVRVRVSFDAGSADTYHRVRRGGDWNRLVDSSRFLTNWLAQRQAVGQNKITTTESNFVVQASNYREMPDFVNLCLDIGFDKITFQKVVNWNTWIDAQGQDQFDQHAVWMPNHADHADFLSVLQHPILQHPRVSLGNVV